MKKYLVNVLLAAAACIAPMAQAEVLNLSIGEWAPFTSEKDPKGKLVETVVREAFKLEGIDVKYSYFPWKRSSSMVEEGSADGSFPWSRTSERENAFYINAIPLLVDESVYFHLKSSPFDWKTIDDIKKYKAGAALGYKNEKVYKDLGLNFEVAPTEELNFKKLLAGRIDVFDASKEVGYALINKSLSADEAKLITHHPKAVEQTPYFIMFSKKNPNGKALADKMDSGLKKLKASGAYDKIFAK